MGARRCSPTLVRAPGANTAIGAPLDLPAAPGLLDMHSERDHVMVLELAAVLNYHVPLVIVPAVLFVVNARVDLLAKVAGQLRKHG